MFEEKEKWWDLLCNVSTGEVRKNATTIAWDTDLLCRDYDMEYYKQAIAGVHSHVIRATGEHVCEEWMRSHFFVCFLENHCLSSF